jgi:peptidoglycan hydrolase CwlO-like protein
MNKKERFKNFFKNLFLAINNDPLYKSSLILCSTIILCTLYISHKININTETLHQIDIDQPDISQIQSDIDQISSDISDIKDSSSSIDSNTNEIESNTNSSGI